ncbi:hypothetical protein BPO_0617 [Bergeyella porcorum]|uniref:DUF4197 domain-containing protein n=1 Tax=Bergeyella porcorum TaxID=1735111 RepID=A0AAU0F0N8_9FLAO
MKIKTVLIASVGVATVATTAHSCLALATSSVGLAVIKTILLGGIKKGLATFKDPNAFLENNLIDQAMPQQLRNITNVLEKVAPNVVQKQRTYLAQAAAYTANVSEPILTNAVNGLTAEDITRISNGGSGVATQILKEKTEQQLIATIAPRVEQELNKNGITKTINAALQGNNLLGGILGGNTASSQNVSPTGLSQMLSGFLVDGLFNLVEDYEKQNQSQIINAIKK